MVIANVCNGNEKHTKDKGLEVAQELTNCDALNESEEYPPECLQRLVEKPRPFTASENFCPNHRDKESLLDELFELKNAIVDQAFHMKLHIQHHGQVQEENKKLEKSIENLEIAYGLEAPRVGGENKLTSKLLGLKARLGEKQVICNSREVEIGLLRKDIRVTHCRELEIERDLFATEVGTLQKTVRGLRRVYVRVNSENNEIQNLRQKISKLENSNKELNNSIASYQKSIKDSKEEIDALVKQSSIAQSATNTANSKNLELEKHSQVLARLKHQEECERLRLEHSILKVGDETRQILKDKIAAEKQALYNAQAAQDVGEIETKKKFKAPDQPPDSPSGDAMAQLEAEFIAEVETAAVEFIETVPASQPPSPKSEEQLKVQHVTFENRKDFFTEKVEDAEIRFLMAMEEIEYGKAQTRRGQTMSKKFTAAEKARLAAEEMARKFAEDAKKAQEEAARLQAELEKLQAMGSGNKRWKSEKVSVMLGKEVLEPSDFRVEVQDKGAEIDIDVDISSRGAPSSDEALEAKLKSAREKAEAEAKRLDEELRKAQAERDRLAAELAKSQSAEDALLQDAKMKEAQAERDRLAAELAKLQSAQDALLQDAKMKEAQAERDRLAAELAKSQSAEDALLQDAKMKEAQAERDRLAAELAKLQSAQDALLQDAKMKEAQAERDRLAAELAKSQSTEDALLRDAKMKEAQAERDRLAAELAKFQSAQDALLQDAKMKEAQAERDRLAAGGKRWKNETISVVMGDKELSKDEYKLTVLDKGAHIDIDVHIQDISSKIEGGLEMVKELVVKTKDTFFDDESSKLIKTNIDEVLQYLETIAAVVVPKSDKAGPSQHDATSS